MVRTSGTTGKGIDKLLETLLLTAELQEFKANPDREDWESASRRSETKVVGRSRGSSCKGNAARGDNVLCGATYGRIRAMYNDRDEAITEAGPSTPVKVSGLSDVPGAGDHFFVMKDIEEARETAESRLHEGRTEALSSRVTARTRRHPQCAPRGFWSSRVAIDFESRFTGLDRSVAG